MYTLFIPGIFYVGTLFLEELWIDARRPSKHTHITHINAFLPHAGLYSCRIARVHQQPANSLFGAQHSTVCDMCTTAVYYFCCCCCCWPAALTACNVAFWRKTSSSLRQVYYSMYELVQAYYPNFCQPRRMPIAMSTRLSHIWYHTERTEQRKRVTYFK